MDRFECERVSDLQHRILREPGLFAEAIQYFTVQVSEMFRDPEYFLALRREVVPVLSTYPSIKIWVAGCSSGEEVWSLAILLEEEGLLERTVIYATDINQDALAKAEEGSYRADRLDQFSANYLAAGGRRALSDYYAPVLGHAVFDRRLIRQVVFADHSLATDAVFSEIHLVSCRNVLIYFNRELQDRAVELFSEALVRKGFLGVGSKESLQFGNHVQRFEPFVASQRIYQRRAS
jgi:chemotaxis protein methyltransferase CheR